MNLVNYELIAIIMNYELRIMNYLKRKAMDNF